MVLLSFVISLVHAPDFFAVPTVPQQKY